MVSSRIVSQKIIMPCAPTPSSLRRHNLSFFDRMAAKVYSPIAIFYSKPKNYDLIPHILEKSLSKVLASYYPFAGRMNKDNISVHCNDKGAELLNVRVNCPMSEIVNHPYNEAANVVFPQDLPWSTCTSLINRSLLVAQLNHFDCGGIAISMCLSHSIADGYSAVKFLTDWAATAASPKLDYSIIPSPQFDLKTIVPPKELDLPAFANNIEPDKPKKVVTRRYHFSSSRLGRLKDMVAMDATGVENPSGTEVATALLHKCSAIAAMENSKDGSFQPSVVSHIVNLRPPFPLHAIGNSCSYFTAIAGTEDEIQVPKFAAQLRKAKHQSQHMLKDMSPDQLISHTFEKMKTDSLIYNGFDHYLCSSMPNFPLREIDFGWGRPTTVTTANLPIRNYWYFFGSPSGDGIDALVTLREEDMLVFQSNNELLEFAFPVGQSPI